MNKKLLHNYAYNTLYQLLILIAPFITTPYVSRVLGVTNIGIYQYSQSIANYFVLIGAVGTSLYGQREIAYLQDKPEERSVAFWEIELFRLGFTILCSFIYYFVFCIHGKYPDIYTILSLEVVATAFDISWFFMGLENFKLTVIRNTIIKLTGIICVFLFVKKSSDLPIYTLCMTVPLFIGNISLWFSLKRNIVKTNLTIRTLVEGICLRFKSIVILFLPQIAADVYLLLDKTMIGILGSNIDQVGFYSQGQKIVQIVLRIVTSLGTVMLPTMSALFAKGDQEGVIRSVKKAFSFIFMLSFPLLFGLFAVAPRFVPLFFGEGYGEVVPLLRIISPILVIIATSNVIGKQYLLPTNQQNAFTVSILAGAVTNVILNIILIRFFDAVGASIATVIAELTVTVVQCLYVKNQLPLKECLSSSFRYCLFSIIMFALVEMMSLLLPSKSIWALLILIIAGVIIYAIELAITRDPMLEMGIGLIRSRKKSM